MGICSQDRSGADDGDVRIEVCGKLIHVYAMRMQDAWIH